MLYTLVEHAVSTNDSARYTRTLLKYLVRLFFWGAEGGTGVYVRYEELSDLNSE